MSEYKSGACNIGKAEIHRRYQAAIAGWFLYLVVVIWFASVNASVGVRLLAFIPAYLTAIGFLQGRRKFCVAYGFMGVFNFEGLGKIEKVSDAEFKSNDRNYAIRILGQAALIALVLTFIALIP